MQAPAGSRTDFLLGKDCHPLEHRVYRKCVQCQHNFQAPADYSGVMNAEPQFRQVLDLMLEGIQIHDTAWRYTYVNDALIKYSQYSREELLGYTPMEKYPGMEQTELFAAMQRSMTQRTNEKLQIEFYFPNGSKGNFEVSIQPVPEGILMVSIDRTEHYKDEVKLKKATRLYAFISAINQSIVHLDTEKELLDNACRVAVEIGEFKMAWITSLDENGILSIAGIRGNADMVASARNFTGLHVNDERLRDTPTGKVFSTGHYILSNNIENDPAMMGSWKAGLLQHGIKSVITLPITKFKRVVGTFGFMSEVENFFDEAELSLLLEAAGDISFALENFERTQKHQEAEARVIKNEKRFRALIENSADVKTLTSLAGQHLYASPAVHTILGYTPEEILAHNVFDMIHPEDVADFKESRQAITAIPGASFAFQHRRLHKNGTWVWCEGSVTNMLHEPAVGALVSNLVDITQKKQAEQQRDFNRNNLRALINNTADLMWSVDLNFNLITSNETFHRWMEKTSTYSIQPGHSVFSETLPTEWKQRFQAAYNRAFAGESFTQLEHRHEPDEFWLDIAYTPIWENTRIIGAACHARNITESKRAEAHLQQTVNELIDYQYALDVSSIVALTDKRGIITFVNQNFCAISHYTQEELVGHDHRMVNSGHHPKEFFTQLWATIAQGKVWKGEIKNRTKYGKDYWVSTTIVPFLDKDKRPYQYMAIRQDITERKLAEENLICKNQELEKTNAELDRFVYSASHDLRSPLASILGLLYFVETESTEPPILEYARMIRESINRLDGFIKNILNYSRNNRTERELTHIPLHTTITTITTQLGNAKEAAGIRFEVAVQEHHPFYTDAQRFAIVLENLIGNAIKFTDYEKADRYIRITGTATATELVLHVADNGIGIPAQFLPKIFNMFYRLDSTRVGSGIGLYIVKETLEVLEGSVTVTSVPKEGTQFTVTFKNFAPAVQEY
jgi:PAS domain S-box-containing protein